MIIGQIHSDGSNSGQAAPLVKLLYQLRLDQGRVQALVRERPDDSGTRVYTLMDGIPWASRSATASAFPATGCSACR